jgi:hypothetical protein
MFNEPDGIFWFPKPNVTQYITLAQATGQAVKAATPSEVFYIISFKF